MDNQEKNLPFIKNLTEKLESITGIRETLQASYNNRENSLVVTKLQEAEHWLTEQIEKLK